MAHWAELDENNVVLRVLVGNNDDDREGLTWIEETLGGRWVQTSYNANFGGKFAGIGDTYNEASGLFEPVVVPLDPNAPTMEFITVPTARL